ncbi:hypothetical protein HaLaN_00971 [Haematococcus lacustris]|uniref:Uncharacterized protein n=1 Tax=Haematococcus lacustris TaxID=44745 RepID=A0A699YAH8_HAELA|nr:hypothetical protein HaLaN_00971 [Haematococcus lacustris]
MESVATVPKFIGGIAVLSSCSEVWQPSGYRWLFMVASRYTYINTLTPLASEATEPWPRSANIAISERGVIGSLLLGFLVRGLFTLHVADQLDAQGQPLSYTDTDIPVSAADIPDLNCDNLFRQLCHGLLGEGENTRPSAAVAAVLAAHPDLSARLEAIPRHLSDTNMVDHVGQQLQTAFSNMLTLLFAGRLKNHAD